MKMILQRMKILLFGLMVGLLGQTSWAYFFDYGTGVRPTGMGRAYVAVADDVNAINWNPAGLALLDRYEITTMYAGLFAGFEGRLFTGQRDMLGYNYIAAAVPIDPIIGFFGGSWSRFSSMFYRENIVTIGYARTLTFTNFDYTTAHVGMNLKIMNWSSDATDYSSAESKTGITADVGILYPLPEKFVAGVCVENIIPANVGVTTYEEVPRNFRVGVSWSQDLQPLGSIVDGILFSAELVNRSYMQNKTTVRFGTESWFFNGLAAARMGVNSTEFTVSVSGKYLFEALNMTQLQLDYAFVWPFYIQKTYGTHRLALTASWGKLTGTKIERAEKALVEALEPEENLAEKRDQELAEQRAQEKARLKALKAQLRAEIKEVRKELDRISELIKLGQIPSIQFESGKTILRRNSFKSLDQIGAMLEKYPRIKVRLEGHTDSQGKAKLNQKLSQRRVESVKEYMLGKFKLNPYNLIPVGYGETRSIADNKTAKGRAANRRVEIKVLMPAGMEAPAAPFGPKDAAEDTVKEPISPEDIVSYEELDKLWEKLKVYEMQMSTDEVEELFEQQHQENGKNQVKEEQKKKQKEK